MKEEKKELEAESKKEKKEEEHLEKDPDAPVDAEKMAEKNEHILKDKVIVEHDEKDVKKADKNIAKAKKALEEEEKAIKKEDTAEKVLDNEKKKEALKDEKENAGKVFYETVPDKDVEIRSGDLKHEVAGNYRKSKDLLIHDHPVWIKVQPAHNRLGYFQAKHWHITDLANLPGMLADQKTDPKTQWDNHLITSVNQPEFFYEAIWNDGKNELKPDTKIASDAPQEAGSPKPEDEEAKKDEAKDADAQPAKKDAAAIKEANA